jgi:hypothetical protein
MLEHRHRDRRENPHDRHDDEELQKRKTARGKAVSRLSRVAIRDKLGMVNGEW